MKNAGFTRDTIEAMTDYMETDCTNDYNTYAVWTRYELTHFDDCGVEYEVEILPY